MRTTIVFAVQLLVVVIARADPNYTNGFIWNRYLDWTPGSVQNTSNGNPMPDAQGQPVWYCDRVPMGAGLGAETPWYRALPTPLVWDGNWYGSGIGVWAQGDDLNPCIGPYWLSHNLDPNVPHDEDMIRWRNPTGRPVSLDITGTLEFWWDGTSGHGPDCALDVIIARHNTNTDVYAVLLEQSIPKPVPGDGYCTTTLVIHVTNVAVGAEHEIRLSLHGEPVQPDPRWVTIIDSNLTYRLNTFGTIPVITNIAIGAAGCLIGVNSLMPGGGYVLRQTHDLITGGWSNAVPFDAMQAHAVLTNDISGATRRFYRVYF